MNLILTTVILSVLSAYLYRQGGSATKPKWLWKARDLGCSLCVIAWLLLNGIHSWFLILCVGLMWGALSTYWSFLTPDDDNEYWWNFALHGFFIGFALFPLAISGDMGWFPLLYRSLALGGLIGLWSGLITNAVVEECGRGALIILTLLIIGV